MNFLENLLAKFPSVRVHPEKRLAVGQLLERLIKDGREQLHVIADFDFTLTRYEKNGKHLPSTFAVIESDPRVQFPDGSPVRSKTDALRRKFHAIEYDPQLTVEEKIPHMIEWWRTVQSYLLNSTLNRSMFREIVHQSDLELRDGVRTFVLELFRNEVPLLIFSAGLGSFFSVLGRVNIGSSLGDVIDLVLEKEIPEFREHRDTSHVVSNFIHYGANGELLSFDEKLIHSFNKNEHEIHRTKFFQIISRRHNAILLGDTLGDVDMASGIKHLQNLLKIGFLNQTTAQKLEVYQVAYDLVICDTDSFEVPNLILSSIFQ